MSIGEKLKELRNAHEYTLSDLADKINIDFIILVDFINLKKPKNCG